ncbi:MAG: S-adenosylmethionine:tRNA ribosyltransferase-isomerase [SAR116 cluster bacterium]|nr:MAG: S-adenosylmethionine:tRNA ribosyltransferase-isomerase [SAR116 cluster bacterium]
MFAAHRGAVAAPTAGLHFTPALMQRLAAADIGLATVTLHVGAGTFLPVTVENVADHHMHSEWGHIPAATADRINATRSAGGRIVAVGTTSLRILEACVSVHGDVREYADETDIFITPGFRFGAVDMLMTNFHLPKSTLLMLVSAFAGMQPIRNAYAHALDGGYRFFSYGDACLMQRADR